MVLSYGALAMLDKGIKRKQTWATDCYTVLTLETLSIYFFL